MSLELCILASGSKGNCALVRTSSGAMLIDAGIGPRATADRLHGTGISLSDIRAICLTHLDSDHFRESWTTTILAHQIHVFCHDARQRELLKLINSARADAAIRHDFRRLLQSFDRTTFQPLRQIEVQPIRLAHDAHGSHGFVIEGFGARIGYASDLGRVPRALLDRFVGLDLIALESNYDPRMQMRSARPSFVKSRIMGGRGHLSNKEAFDAIRAILDRCERARVRLPEHIVLLHRSLQCNCPRLVRSIFERDARIARRLTLAEQFQRTDWLRLKPVRPNPGNPIVLHS